MSSTNKTTYYELPQFVANDIFNPMADDNDAYQKIDTALHNIADAEANNATDIVGIKNRLDGAESDIDALEAQNGSNTLTTVAQTLSGAVNELKSGEDTLDGKLDIVENDINNAATGLKARVGAIEAQNGSEVLTTTAQTLTGAVNELDDDINNASTGLKAQISALETQNGDSVLTTTAQTLSGAINELDSDINTPSTGLAARITSAENDIEVLNRTINKKIVFIGDSYMQANYQGAGTSFARLAANAIGLTENVDYWISAVGGYGFARPNLQFITLLQNISISIDDGDVTDVIVAGGANDVDYISGIESAIAEFNTACHTRFPNAKLHLAFTDWFMGNGYNYNSMIKAWKNGAYAAGASFVDGIWMAQHSWDWKVEDGHPNANGQAQIAKCLVNYLLTGSIVYPYIESTTTLINNQNNISAINGSGHFSRVHGLDAELNLVYTVFMFTDPVSLLTNSSNEMPLAQIYSGCFVGCAIGGIRYLVPIRILDDTDTWIETTGELFFATNIMKLQVYTNTAITAKAIALRPISLKNAYYNC